MGTPSRAVLQIRKRMIQKGKKKLKNKPKDKNSNEKTVIGNKK